MSDARRADPFTGDIDISGFSPTIPKKPPVQKEVIREVSEQNNFPSRAPARAAASPKPVVETKLMKQQRRRRTGRNVQFNIKATAETVERFTALADKHGLVFGELLERALDAFQRDQMKP